MHNNSQQYQLVKTMPSPTAPKPHKTKNNNNSSNRKSLPKTNTISSLNILLFTVIITLIILTITRLHTLIHSYNKKLTKLNYNLKFLPLKDLRFAATAMEGNTWFMSSLNSTHNEGQPLHLHFPSNHSHHHHLCLAGRDARNGTMNSYALAPQGALQGYRVRPGLTFVADTYYSYDNLFHGLTALAPFVAWHGERGCAVPERWILYHHGEVRNVTSAWLEELMKAVFGGGMKMEVLDERPRCFEEAVVFRHNEGGMSEERKLEVYDMMRCKAREYCGVVSDGGGDDVVRVTLLLRVGARSFKDDKSVAGVFERECGKVEGCKLKVANADHLSFCEQVKLLSETDVVASPHGAQMTNMIFMDKYSSIMEFFPKGWLEFAGVGKDVFHWIAGRAGLRHTGAYYDPQGDPCPHGPSTSPKCWPFYKNRQIGNNETFFSSWAARVINEMKQQKLDRRKGKSRENCKCSFRNKQIE